MVKLNLLKTIAQGKVKELELSVNWQCNRRHQSVST